MPAKCPSDGDGEKVELVWTHMPNEQLRADETSRIWHGRWIWNPKNQSIDTFISI